MCMHSNLRTDLVLSAQTSSACLYASNQTSPRSHNMLSIGSSQVAAVHNSLHPPRCTPPPRNPDIHSQTLRPIIPETPIRNYNLAFWSKPCSCTNLHHQTLQPWYPKPLLQNLQKRQLVQCGVCFCAADSDASARTLRTFTTLWNHNLSHPFDHRNYNNAFWSETCFCATFGDGDGVEFFPLVSLDVVGHEIWHGGSGFTPGFRATRYGLVGEG